MPLRLQRPPLSNHVQMSASSDSNGQPAEADGEDGVLANLPRTRPQRSSARRAAARRQSARNDSKQPAKRAPVARAKAAKPKKADAQAATARPAAAQAATARQPPRRKPATTRAAPPKVDETVPRQGFESELDRARGPVQPPGGAELVASAAELIGELARGGLSAGERLLRDALSWLPRS